MALSGRKGKVTIGADAIAGLASWSLSLKNPAINVVACDMEVDANINSGVIAADGTLTFHYDPTDVNGQEAMTNAILNSTEITLKLYPEGAGVANKKYWTLVVILTEEKESGAPKDKIGREYTYTTGSTKPSRDTTA